VAKKDETTPTPLRMQTLQTLIALKYPNGRVYERAVDHELGAGERFEMYGRTWTTTIQRKKSRRKAKSQPRTLCVPAQVMTSAPTKVPRG